MKGLNHFPMLYVATMLILTSCGDAGQSNNNSSFDSLKSVNFQVDPFWPQQLPNNWILGETPGLSIDNNDHVWILQRPGSLDNRELGAADSIPRYECCAPAPSVIEFDQSGAVVNSWNIFKPEESNDPDQLWSGSEHGIFIDDNDFVWITDAKGHMVLKLTVQGERVLQIGVKGKTNGSNDTTMLGGPADVAVDIKADEVYVADGYANRRVIVFDASTGEYKRHWGAYGEMPHDDELPKREPGDGPIRSFRTAIHAVTLSKAGQVYVADRSNNRIQIFEKDGTFVRETFVANDGAGGSIWDIEFSRDPDQTHMYVADGMNMKVWVLDHASLEVITSFGHGGRNAGQFGWVHSLAIDSRGIIYTSEVKPGKRIQKFVPIAGEID